MFTFNSPAPRPNFSVIFLLFLPLILHPPAYHPLRGGPRQCCHLKEYPLFNGALNKLISLFAACKWEKIRSLKDRFLLLPPTRQKNIIKTSRPGEYINVNSSLSRPLAVEKKLFFRQAPASLFLDFSRLPSFLHFHPRRLAYSSSICIIPHREPGRPGGLGGVARTRTM